MKKFLFIFTFFLASNLNCNDNLTDQNSPLITVVIMIKNEEAVICPTLEPFVKNGINSYLILDTGSTDKTIDVVKDYFVQNNITNFHIFQEPFIDFSTSRNRALELAREKFANSTFLFMPDAEWYMKNVPGLIDFCKKNIEDTADCYMFRLTMPGNEENLYHARLIRTKSNVHFNGIVHEYAVASNMKRIPEDIYVEYCPKAQGGLKSANRWLRDKDLLLKEYEKNPNDPRTCFYLAQTFECLGDLMNAYKYYVIRSKQSTFPEENYETFYRLGRVTDYLSKNDKNFTWHMAFDYYTEAHKVLPHRAEPLINIAEHYWPDNIPMCYLFAKRTLDMPYPKDDFLFVRKDVYDFKRYEILSKSAGWIGDYETGENATRTALKKQELPHLYRNLSIYIEKKSGK